MTPRLEFICVGTELLTGKVNTHTAYLGQKLSDIGLHIAREHAVGDNAALMRETFAESFRRSDIVVTAGGLGPTFDDITRETWSQVLARPLTSQHWLVDDIKAKFLSRGIKMPPRNRRQAMVLRGAEVIPNAFGTAPGQFVRIGRKAVVLLPGPGRELFPMVEQVVLPRLKEIYPGHFSIQKSFLIFGTPESRVDEMIRPWVARRNRLRGCRITHGILASQLVITVKFNVEGKVPLAAQNAAHQLGSELKRILGDMIFGQENDTLEGVIGALLKAKKKTLAVAESCTGGLIGKMLTDVSGASEYFLEGIVTYSNASKMRRLGVTKRTLDRHGAVSSQTAKEMAEGLRRTAGVDYAISVTGIAGPDGGTPEKPVGLVHIGLARPGGTRTFEFRFRGERLGIRQRAAMTALDLLRRELTK